MRTPLPALLGGCLVLLALGCGGEAVKGAQRVSVQVWGEPEEIAVYRSIAKAFEQDHHGTRINLVEVPEKQDHLAKLIVSFAAGRPPDVFLINYREFSQFVSRGAITPVGPKVRNAVDLEAYFPQAIEAFTFHDQLQCMPQNVSSLVVYYNKHLFSEAGLAHPPAGWGWEQFRSIARTLTKGAVRGLGLDPSIIRLAPFVWSNGGELVDDQSSPTRLELSSPAAQEALSFLTSLVRDEQVVPTESEVRSQNLEERFAVGKLGMYLSSRRATPFLREVKGLKWDVAALPIAKKPAGILHSDGYCVASRSSQRRAAFDFVRFATGSEGQTIAAVSGRVVPSLKWVAATKFEHPFLPPEHSSVFLDAIPVIRRTPVIPTWPQIEDAADQALEKTFYEPGYGLEEALDEMTSSTRSLFEEARK